MSAPNPAHLKAQFQALRLSRHVGRVMGVQGGVIRIQGLANVARIGDRLELKRNTGSPLHGEVLQVDADAINMLPDAAPDGVALGNRVILQQMPEFAPSASWIGRVVDPFGRPLDGRPLLRGEGKRDLMASPPPAVERKPLGARMSTGMSVLNTVLPIVQGQRIGLFAGSGVGKSSLLAQLAKSMQADAVVVALIGERGREVNEFVEKTLGAEGMDRAVVIAATSDQSALVRRRCAWAAMSVAETLRDEGMNVLFLADSITRFAEAHREISVSQGEAPALRGYPPSVTPLITGLCERAGPGTHTQGDITAVFSVLVAGSDMDEPVADILRGVLDGHIVLNREIAERGRYPAIDVSRSVSRSLPDAATAEENDAIHDVRRLIGAYEQSEVMIKAGLYAEGADPVLDQAVRVFDELDGFFARPEPDTVQASFDRLNLILRRAHTPPPMR
ncbi:Flagellum-specific ATP synthase [Falsiruegeria litorea R37]|uniref:Flagellum-specific ATP synthase n=1 Tax=Falsiruegeria litorea R37 TaxID=1200284 RepID=A0A1Y5THC1_9RHOB|nr:FliI/YscN family ATPase [Falsiruegeria litorea]SLN63814.1 Flagellum-specific ATP synthase [Falsiruegeria litorea R37]